MRDTMDLSSYLQLTSNGLGVYLEQQAVIVIADLHIGLEYALMGDGTYLPVLQYPNIERSILEMVEEHKVERIIIDGDFKHEFARATNQEWTEILDLWDALKEVKVDLDLVRGNHDNYLVNVLKQRGKSIFDPALHLDHILITHGHKPFDIPDGVDTVILAHEHPALGFRDETGGKHRFKCYLYGKIDGRDVLVLPAYSPMAPGTIVNGSSQPKFLSHWLRNVDTTSFTPIVVDKGEVLNFPPLKDLEPVEIYDDWLDRLDLYEKALEDG